MAFPIPPGYEAGYLGEAGSLAQLGGLKPLEEAQGEGTPMLLGVNFQWRFPLFQSLADGLNWGLKQAGVTPWPGQQDLVFLDPVEPVWYIAWVKGMAWLPAILAALTPVITAAAFALLGFILWKVAPREVVQPISDALALLPLLLVLGVVMVLPQLTGRIFPEEE